jgi:hypothetical protein
VRRGNAVRGGERAGAGAGGLPVRPGTRRGRRGVPDAGVPRVPDAGVVHVAAVSVSPRAEADGVARGVWIVAELGA